jgi:trimeric autotransporter adhesin
VDVQGLNSYLNKGRKQPKDEQRRAEDEKMQAVMKQSEEKAGKIVYNGFVAQEVEEAAEKLKYEFSGVDKPQTEGGLYGLRYADFVVPLVKAVQELSQQNEKLKSQLADVDELKKENADIRQQLAELKALIGGGNNTAVNVSGAFLETAVPNPSRSSTTIRYGVPDGVASARLTLTNAKGQVLKMISLTSRGTGQINLNTTGLPSGVYNYTLWVNGTQAATKQMVIAK